MNCRCARSRARWAEMSRILGEKCAEDSWEIRSNRSHERAGEDFRDDHRKPLTSGGR
ncbi:hypothetical protein ZHAS_00004093 [Anopheles sinensis]|uniref:Uncharacterized protein n=1 Tax=Anopheles sinensis TaxID=74873 RepID=A0A084VG28_ANOSI|nr:hypothetical protein ZHAS_00004093 [Anopheles sinensis]